MIGIVFSYARQSVTECTFRRLFQRIDFFCLPEQGVSVGIVESDQSSVAFFVERNRFIICVLWGTGVAKSTPTLRPFHLFPMENNNPDTINLYTRFLFVFLM
jgi:hypothetical protein